MDSQEERAAVTKYSLEGSKAVIDHISKRTLWKEGAFILPFLKEGMKILDMGCGPGTITIGIAKKVGPTGKVVGLDLSPQSLKLASERAQSEGLSNIEFVEGSALKLPFKNEEFDGVWTSAVLCHCWSHRSAIFQEVLRVLKPGGFFASREPDSWIGYPEFPNLARYRGLINELIKKNGGELLPGRKVPSEGARSGLKVIQVSFGCDEENMNHSDMGMGEKLKESGFFSDESEMKELQEKVECERKEFETFVGRVSFMIWCQVIFSRP